MINTPIIKHNSFMKNSINPAIFKAYDIRGLYPSEINEAAVYNIGRALVRHTGAKKMAVGFDMRGSSLNLQKELIRGITDQGANVVKIGLSTTPMLYFASWKMEDIDAAVMITASHNPAEYNGLKLCRKNAVPIGEGSGMEEIKKLAIEDNFLDREEKGIIIENNDLRKEYIEYIAGFFRKPAFDLFGAFKVCGKKIVIDFANAMGILDKEIYEKFPKYIEPVYLFDKLDGSFPNHEANPIKPETLKILQEKVISEKADLGVAYDGDADRVGFVDEKGEIVPMDFMIAILAGEVLKKNPGGLVLMDLRSSNAVREIIEKAGGIVHNCRVGHSLIKKQMREENAVFAGELSGHYFFEENKKAEMTALAVLTLLNLLNETGKKMSELTANLKKYYHSGEINSDVEDKTGVMNKLKEKYSDGKLSELDGIRIDFPDWWLNVRPSNTEPKLRLNLEAKTREMMEEKRDEILAIIRS
jgi:phosphomannomutase